MRPFPMMPHTKAATVSLVLTLLAMVFTPGLAEAASATRTTAFTYDSNTGLLLKEIIEPDTPALRLDTTYTRTAYGAKASETISGSGVATRTSQTYYHAHGHSITEVRNALGHRTLINTDLRFGKASSQTDPNGLASSWQYDEFGRKVLETRPDGTRTRWAYAYCSGVAGGSASCPSRGAYVITKTPLVPAAQGGAQNGVWVKEYRDQLGRVIASETQSFDGSKTIRVDKEYDAQGRLTKQSVPYFLGQTRYWTIVTYDTLGRPISERKPDNSVTTTTYNGLTTTVTNAKNQTVTTVRNARGLKTRVTDALGKHLTYVYDPFDNLTRVTDPVGNVVTYSYDRRGRKTAMSDPDLGNWSYSYNVLDQLTSRTDAKSQTASFAYDKLGRKTSESLGGATATWSYDTGTKGLGKLARTDSGAGVVETFTYDGLGRPYQNNTHISGATYTHTTTYDNKGRVDRVTSPSGFSLRHTYNNLGSLRQVIDGASGHVYWTPNDYNAEGQLTRETAGNGVITTRSYHAARGSLTGIHAAKNGVAAVANYSYSFDAIGNLTARSDLHQNVSESFSYDALNRVITYAIAGRSSKSVTYDAVGNIRSKTDVGTYHYPAPGQARPHAVSSVSGVKNASYNYDANGNLLSGDGRSISWTAFNHPASITRGTESVSFTYTADRQRVSQTSSAGTKLYLNGPGLRTERLSGIGSSVTWTDYIMVGDRMIGQRVKTSTSQILTRYYTLDHLGSVAVITTETGSVTERLAYDAWGKRRHANGNDDPAGALTSQSSRGFTGHEMLDSVDLVHMNARIYDPLLGRFLSADPMVKYPNSTQGWNRYSYADNNPLSRVDPSGYGWFSKVFRAVRRVFKSKVGRAVIAVAAAFAMQHWVMPHALAGTALANTTAGATLTAAVSGATAGAINSGSLRGAAMGAMTATAFFGVGELTGFHGASLEDFATASHFANIAGHAVVGCASAAAQGGQCGSGALSAGFGSLATPVVADMGDVRGLIATTVVGGTTSVLSGGEFANGAVTSAFGYMFNHLAHRDIHETRKLHEVGRRNLIGSVRLTHERYASIYRKHGGDPVVQNKSYFFNEDVSSFADFVANVMDPTLTPLGANAPVVSPARNMFEAYWTRDLGRPVGFVRGSSVPTSRVTLHIKFSSASSLLAGFAGKGNVWNVVGAYPGLPNN